MVTNENQKDAHNRAGLNSDKLYTKATSND